MKKFSSFFQASPVIRVTTGAATLALMMLGLLFQPAHAQVQSAPIAVKKTGSKNASTAAKESWLKAEVIHADANSIIVREQANGMMVHTFTYTAELRPQMQKLVDQGGYQYGDKVQILYQNGQTVALKVRGKPSKPL
jgi:hypothetical protein